MKWKQTSKKRNKLTTIFHGRCEFWTLDVISLMNNSVDRAKLLSFYFLAFTITTSISCQISLKSAREWQRRSEKKLRYRVISMVCTLIDHSSRPISAREIAQLFENWYNNIIMNINIDLFSLQKQLLGAHSLLICNFWMRRVRRND